jgi:hypothetical protein
MPQLELDPIPVPIPQDATERRAWREKLRLRLQDPALRATPGFPKATDEAILALSDPPYYTACPNPFLAEILAEWRADSTSPTGEEPERYHRDPFATDVSEGKNDPIYNAHSYHTKVPHKAIMRYILHYTDPGDIVLDGFCGTGMTGVAAQLCGDQKTVESLGYFVDERGCVYDTPANSRNEAPAPLSKLGSRRAVLVDLSPAATFIAYNYNTPVDATAFEREARRILAEVEAECGWMYETTHADGKTQGKINYTVWSDVFLCPQCSGEMIFWDVAVDHAKGEVRDEWDCPHCRACLSKSPRKESGVHRVERAFETRFDRAIGQTLRQAKQVPVLINYSVGKKRHEKRPDADDLAIIRKIEESDIPYPFPAVPMMLKGANWGDTWRSGYHAGFAYVHHFYTQRSLWVLAALWTKMSTIPDIRTRLALQFLWQSLALGYTKLNRYGATHYSQVNRILNGTLYVSSLLSEVSLHYAFDGKLDRLTKAFRSLPSSRYALVNVQSSSDLTIPDAAIDYIFVDPPFGANLMYSELNFLWEAWLGILTNNNPEAVMNKTQRKDLSEYRRLMEACFREFYRVLKPGRWMTVEFHNSQNTVWNAIQEALLRAGFMVADVRTLDKQQGTFKQVTTTSAVKQDLIISLYKPDVAFEQRFLAAGGNIGGAWDFTRQHLEQLAPPALKEGSIMEFIEERAPYLLYDRMVAFHVQRGLPVPLSAPEFYAGLNEHFIPRDGMIFTVLQAAEYDRLRLLAERVEQLPMFITDEKSALQWLRRELDSEQGHGPQTYQDLNPRFKIELHQLPHEAMPELLTMLEEGFLKDEITGQWRNPDPGKDEDLRALREKALLREFGSYLKGKGRLKIFRAEAVRVGFSRAWREREYDIILQVAVRLPERVLQEDAQLLMYVDNARLRAAEKPHQPTLL